jgi:predicted RNA binding protein YcfA (HicA-like mRNA interferase family)
MTKMKRVSGEKVVKALRKMGFDVVRQRGSHVVMKKVTIDGAIGCVIPMHKEIALGTLHNILKQAHITVDEFAEHL